jgi:hypothetical protein
MVVLFGGFMYVKNYISIGNPLFPVDVRIFGKTIFKGLMDNATYRLRIAEGDKFELMKIIFSEGLGVQFLTLILPGTFLTVFLYKYIKSKTSPGAELLLLFITPLVMLIFYSFFINIYTMRYFFPYISLGLLTAIIFVVQLPRGDKYLVWVAFISIVASACELAHRYELILSLLLSILFFTALAFYKRKVAAFYKSQAFNRTVAGALLLVVLFFVYFNNKYSKEEFGRYPISSSKKEKNTDIGKSWKWLNNRTKNGASIAYTGRAEFYPLFGTQLKNKVEYISINEKETTAYNKPDGLFRRKKDFSAWIENLKKKKIEYLFIALPFFINRESEDPTKFPIEDEWASGHPELFKLVFENPVARIYSVNLNAGK